MDRDKAETFFAQATQLAETFVAGFEEILEDMSDEEVQELTEAAAEHLSANPNDPARRLIAETINEEYSHRFNANQAPASEKWIDF